VGITTTQYIRTEFHSHWRSIMSASSARSLRRHPKPAAPAPARIPTLLAALVARTQTLDPFAHAWDASRKN